MLVITYTCFFAVKKVLNVEATNNGGLNVEATNNGALLHNKMCCRI